MNIGKRIRGQHSEQGWTVAGEYCVLVPDGEGKLKQFGASHSLTTCIALAGTLTDALVVRFHTKQWSDLLDGSMSVEEYRQWQHEQAVAKH